MTAKELAQNLGKQATARIKVSDTEKVTLDVIITDCRQVYGRVDYQCQYNETQLFWLPDTNVKVSGSC